MQTRVVVCAAHTPTPRATQDTPNLVILGPSHETQKRLAIASFLVRTPWSRDLYLHHDFVSAVLNDLFGIQVRFVPPPLPPLPPPSRLAPARTQTLMHIDTLALTPGAKRSMRSVERKRESPFSAVSRQSTPNTSLHTHTGGHVMD